MTFPLPEPTAPAEASPTGPPGLLLKRVIEALLFASPKPLLISELIDALRAAGEKVEAGAERDHALASEDEVAGCLASLEREFLQEGRGFVLVEQVNGWVLRTNPDAASWVRRLYPEAKPTRLSGPALETLAIIAYRQPVTRADLEAVRGVAVDGVMQVLMDRSLIKISGRAEGIGRPLLYSTTNFFLQHFGLKTVDELPNAAELKRVILPKAPTEPPVPPKESASKAAADSGKPSEAVAVKEEHPVPPSEGASVSEGDR